MLRPLVIAQIGALLGRSAVAELLTFGLALCGYVVAARTLSDVPSTLRWLGAAVSAMWIASVEFHLLSALHAFSIPGSLTAVAISTTIAMRVGAGARPLRSWLHRDVRWFRYVARRFARSPYRTIALPLAVLVGIVVAHSLLLPPLGWDSLTYHAVKAGAWTQHRGFVDLAGPGTWAVYGNYWAGAEVLTAWSMLPFHSDTLAMAMQAAHWLLLALAIIAFVRELGVREPCASSAALFVLATPTARMQVGTGYVEIVGLMFLVSAMALALRSLRKPTAGVLVLAGAAFGLAAGVKIPFLFAGLVGLGVLIARAVAHARHAAVGWSAMAVCAFAAGVAPWLWHAFQSTGFPFSPMPLRLVGLEVGRANPEIQAYMSRPIPPFTLSSELDRLTDTLLRGHENPGPAAVVAAMLGFAALPSLYARRPCASLLISLVLVTSLFEYYSSGLSVIRHYMPSSSVRFALVPLVLATALSATAVRSESGWRRLYLCFLLAGAFFYFGLYLMRDISPGAAAGICALAATFTILCMAAIAGGRRAPSTPLRVAGCAVAGMAFLSIVNIAHGRMRAELERIGFVNAATPPYWLDAATRVDEPSQPRRIALTSGPWLMADNWFAYPFMGGRLQNEVFYVPVAADGVVRHFGPPAVNDEYHRAAAFPAWLERLRRAGVTEVMSFSPPSIELRWMEDNPEHFRRLVGDAGDWGLFSFDQRSWTPAHPVR